MKSNQILPAGTIFTYLNKYLMVSIGEYKATNDFGQQLSGYTGGWDPTHVNNCTTHEDIKIVNESYVGSNMSPLEIWKDYTTQQNELVKKLQEEAENKLANAVYKIKPKEVKKEFLFNSMYTPKGITILVGKNTNGVYMKFNGVKVDDEGFKAVHTILNAKIAGLKIADTTVKLGDMIGNTETLREALKYYYRLSLGGK